MSPARMRSSKSAGAAVSVTCWRSRNATSAGACSRPATGSCRSRAFSAWFAARFSTSSIRIGPAPMAVTNVTSIVRRSRNVSTISLRAIVAMRARAAPMPVVAALMPPALRRCRAACTNASSSDGAPACAISSGAVPAAATLPWPRMTMRSHSAETSCITCDENSRHLPPAASPRSSSRSARVLMMSRPLVGSSSRITAGSWTSARAIATFIRSPCE